MCFTPPMHFRILTLVSLVIFPLMPAALAGGKKEGKAAVSFHMEAAKTDNPKMISIPQVTPDGKERVFFRTPEISTNDIVSFVPFPSEAGEDYGVVFKVKPNAAARLAAVTNTNQGKWLVAIVNGRAADGVMVDKQIDDGRLVVWKGLTLDDIKILDEQFPRTGQEGKKKK